MRKPTVRFPNRSKTNQAIHAQMIKEISDLEARGTVLSV